jgi:hypothetical protein
MTKKILIVLVTIAGALALTAGPASAGSTITMRLQPNFAAEVSCPGFGFGLDIQSLTGRPLGTGQSCIATIDGCDPFKPFCRQTVHTTLTFALSRGSLTVPMTLLEVWPSESSFIQAGRGDVSAGTGDYKGATGRVAGGGAGSFDDEFNFTGRLVYVARVS